MEDRAIIILATIICVTLLGAIVLYLGIDGAVLATIIGVLSALASGFTGVIIGSRMGNNNKSTKASHIETFGLSEESYARAKRQFRKISAWLASNPTHFGDTKSKSVSVETNPDREPIVWD